jgi:hypothetical protein
MRFVLRANGVQNAKMERSHLENPYCLADSVIQISLTIQARYRKGRAKTQPYLNIQLSPHTASPYCTAR